MTRYLTRILCLVCAATVLFSASACGRQNNQVAETTQSSAGQAVATQTTAEQTQAPVKIKMFASNQAYPVPSDLSQCPEIKAIEEKCNVILDLQLLDHAKYADVVQMKFASGDFPDVYTAWKVTAEIPYDNNLIEELTEYIEKYGPNLKKNLLQTSFDAVTFKGKLWAIPSAPALNSPAGSVIYTRKDWMEKAGVKELPKTSDDLLNMWRAYRDCDFNGNGKADEIPFSAREKLTWMGNLYNMWGFSEKNFVYEDGKFMPAFASTQMPKFLEFAAQAYQEKLIDSEFLINTKDTWTNKITQNRVGSWNHVINLASNWYVDLKNSNNGKDVGVIALPTPLGKGYTGRVGTPESPISTVHMIFKASSEEVKIAAVKMFDFFATEEGASLARYGLEGDTLIKDASGNYTYDEAKRQANQTFQWFEQAFGKVQLDSVLNMVKSKDPLEDSTRNQALEVARKEGIPNLLLPAPSFKALVANPDLKYEGQIQQECISRIIVGEKPLSYYNECLERWRKAGGDELIQEATDWWNANMK